MECGGWDGQSDGQVVAHSKPEADSEAGAEALSSRSENIEWLNAPSNDAWVAVWSESGA